MLSRRYRPVAIIAVATVLLMMLVRGWNSNLGMPQGWLHDKPPATNTDPITVPVKAHDPAATEPEKLLVDTQPVAPDDAAQDTGDATEPEKLVVDTQPIAPDGAVPESGEGADPEKLVIDTKPNRPDDALQVSDDDAVHGNEDGSAPTSLVEEPAASETTSPIATDETTSDKGASDKPTPDKTTDDTEDSTATGSSESAAPSTGDDMLFSTEDVDWSRFAYTQYVTNSDYLCNSVMIFETLHRLGSKADRLMMYPSYMLADPEATTSEGGSGKLLIKARDEYEVKLVPVEIQHRDSNLEDTTWNDSYTKLLAFNQTQYDRVLSLDSDSVVLQPMDELFLIPQCPVAMPRAYWLLHDDPPQRILSSQIMLLQPDATEFERITEKFNSAGENEYDMEIVNELYLDSAFILPHRKYDLLSAEFRKTDHELYLGSDREEWDPVAVLNEAKFLHFSDWPVPKPWIQMEADMRQKMQPECGNKDGKTDCVERTMWNGFYDDFLTQREKVCDRGPVIQRSKRSRS